MRIDGHGTGNGLFTFRGVNNDPAYVGDGPTAQREVVSGATLKGFFQKYTIQADTSGKSAMRQLLDELKGDLSQESIDKWAAAHTDKLQAIADGQGLSGEATGLSRNSDGSWTVRTGDGGSSTFALLDASV